MDRKLINRQTLINRRTMFVATTATLAVGCTTAEQEQILGAVLGQAGGGAGSVGGLSQADAAAGIRAALNNGISSAVSTVGRRGGYLGDPRIRIPLPGFLQRTQTTLSRFGLSGALDNLETQLNRGAEAAAPVAKNIFLDAIRGLTIRDAIGIVRGPSNAATQYLQRTTTPRLTGLFRPVMVTALERAGAMRTYDNLVAQLNNVPLAPQYGADAKNDLIDHGVDKGLDGLFHYIGKEEAAIRSNPAKRTSEILRRVFG
ncbi:MAG: hypothetical protein DHS20C05_15310 [Hyphococcus sp.]|nr:MAG: hypothetical protein DHS20C05_15310 [Marinicaulis sp.]